MVEFRDFDEFGEEHIRFRASTPRQNPRPFSMNLQINITKIIANQYARVLIAITYHPLPENSIYKPYL